MSYHDFDFPSPWEYSAIPLPPPRPPPPPPPPRYYHRRKYRRSGSSSSHSRRHRELRPQSVFVESYRSSINLTSNEYYDYGGYHRMDPTAVTPPDELSDWGPPSPLSPSEMPTAYYPEDFPDPLDPVVDVTIGVSALAVTGTPGSSTNSLAQRIRRPRRSVRRGLRDAGAMTDVTDTTDTTDTTDAIGAIGAVDIAKDVRDPRPSAQPYQQSRYAEVHVLLLTWAFHDLKGCFDEEMGDFIIGLEEETARLHDTFETYGYHVHDVRISMDNPLDHVSKKLKKFLAHANDETLLIIYYHGHGGLDESSELVFNSHQHPDDLKQAQAAAAELYAAMAKGDLCPKHDRPNRYQQLLRKYERFQPVSSFRWSDIRSAVLDAPCDLLLILDCCAAGGANLGHLNWEPRAEAAGYTKHLFAACGFESSTRDDMTAALCDVLDDAAIDVTALPLTTKRLHQVVEDRLQRTAVGSQPIFKQLVPRDPERYITLPRLSEWWE